MVADAVVADDDDDVAESRCVVDAIAYQNVCWYLVVPLCERFFFRSPRENGKISLYSYEIIRV